MMRETSAGTGRRRLPNSAPSMGHLSGATQKEVLPGGRWQGLATRSSKLGPSGTKNWHPAGRRMASVANSAICLVGMVDDDQGVALYNKFFNVL